MIGRSKVRVIPGMSKAITCSLCLLIQRLLLLLLLKAKQLFCWCLLSLDDSNVNKGLWVPGQVEDGDLDCSSR
jgi:hypothetical protein